MIPGATAEGTTRWRARHPALPDAHFRSLGGVLVSSVGLRTHQGDIDDATDRAYADAVTTAVTNGVNLLDTAIDYRAQRSERALGRGLAALASAHGIGRDAVVVCTKVGHLPFDDFVPADPDAFIEHTYVSSGLLAPDDIVGGRHAMTPRWLADQLGRSLRNLGTSHIDVYYLQDPELQRAALPPSVFAARLRAAFAHLEDEVAAGRIGRYGVASRTGFRVAPEAADHLSLAELVRAATDVAGSRHHFAVVQVPLSLAMPEAAIDATQVLDGRPCTLLEVAARLEVAVVASTTLRQGHLAHRLPRIVADALPGFTTPAQRALQFVRSLPGVTAALVGMHEPAHVAENLVVVAAAPDPAGVDSLVGRR